jgi:hypothetical protein
MQHASLGRVTQFSVEQLTGCGNSPQRMATLRNRVITLRYHPEKLNGLGDLLGKACGACGNIIPCCPTPARTLGTR